MPNSSLQFMIVQTVSGRVRHLAKMEASAAGTEAPN